MTDERAPDEAASSYGEAYATHYSRQDLAEALRLYAELIRTHPNAKEATYSRAQILNIVHAIVPTEALLDSQINLVLDHLRRNGPS